MLLPSLTLLCFHEVMKACLNSLHVLVYVGTCNNLVASLYVTSQAHLKKEDMQMGASQCLQKYYVLIRECLLIFNFKRNLSSKNH